MSALVSVVVWYLAALLLITIITRYVYKDERVEGLLLFTMVYVFVTALTWP